MDLHHEETSVQVTMIYSRPSDERKSTALKFSHPLLSALPACFVLARYIRRYQKFRAIIRISQDIDLYQSKFHKNVTSFRDPLMYVNYFAIIDSQIEILLKFFEVQIRWDGSFHRFY